MAARLTGNVGHSIEAHHRGEQHAYVVGGAGRIPRSEAPRRCQDARQQHRCTDQQKQRGQSVGSIGSLLGGLLGIADDHTGTVELKGTVVLAKKNILDGQDQRGDWADTIADKRGRKVDIRLVSAELDPATKQPKVSAASSIQDFGYETKEIATGEDEINGYAENGFGQDARN